MTEPDTLRPPPLYRVSPRGRALIEREEGEVLHMYRDSLGYPTVCVGHLIRPGENFSSALTHEECDAILDRDVAPIEAELSARVLVGIVEPEVSALASWMFNNGTGCLRGSQVLAALNAGRERDVPRLLEAWCKGRAAAGGPLVVIPYLLARRRREGAIFAEAWGLDLAPAEGPPATELTAWEVEHLEQAYDVFVSSQLAEIADDVREDWKRNRVPYEG